ncbi:YdiU family protein [Nocardioides sp. R-C-SC26]|uniref:protein adenylyltransferase SelO n=1 Tax=Nocardioides sp. R-C-SC26 TaxID=2870414 RepID=UPI001E509F94|nr:YdiU family protein [Nocardioides sp. R-C-SC26]
MDAAPRLGTDFARALPEMAVAWQASAFAEPHLLVLNEPLAAELGWDADWLASADGVRFLLGDGVEQPVAQAYAGHQFGGFVPRLGDGRALLLGDVVDTAGHRRDVHLKGSGPTPFSRGGDGFAAVGPMLREYVVGEGMHALGVPASRALAVIGTGEKVYREEGALPGAVLVRVASSHLRVGSAQFARALAGQTGDTAVLRSLVAHAIERHHPDAADAPVPALALFESVLHAQARLVARWMHVGFVHGVMNTDNTTLSGETIDYGPCAFLDTFDPQMVFSSIDAGGRYAYGNQPVVLEWNLARLAEALLPLLGKGGAPGEGIDEGGERAVEIATSALQAYRPAYSAAWREGMRAKLGLGTATADDETVARLGHDLLDLLEAGHVDLTTAFRALTPAARGDVEPLRGLMLDLDGVDAWLGRWHGFGPDATGLDDVNPLYLPRNHLVEEALGAATAGDLGPLTRLVDVVRTPFTARAAAERYAVPAPAEAGRYVTYCGT